MKSYRFESANKGEVEISIVWHRCDGCKDVVVTYEEGDGYKEFEDIDGGDVDDIFEWLIDQGIRFKTDRSLFFNWYYVASVMLDEDETESGIIPHVANMPQEQIDRFIEREGFQDVIVQRDIR